MRWLTGWRLPLRLARRDALRSRARSILVLVMIALPVLAVTTAAVVLKTQDLTGVESLDRRLGAAEARIVVQDGASEVLQGFDPDGSFGSSVNGDGTGRAPGVARIRADLGPGSSLLEERTGDVRVTVDHGVTVAQATELDLRDPLTAGLFDLTSGRLPGAADEVVINQALAEKGYAVGDTLERPDQDAPAGETAPLVVGIVESTTARNYPIVSGPLGSLGVDPSGTRTWLVGGPPVSWTQVRALNTIGATVLSRAVVLDPPPDSALDPEIESYSPGTDEATVAVVVLVVVMALLEVVLLAGPAFAVGARRQARSLALMAASGGTPRQARRVVLAGAVVLGGVAAALGVVLGIGLAGVMVPVVQRFSDSWFGPFEVPWLLILGVAAFGLVSALLAAVVPARIASQQDVVAVLAGRRGDQRPSLRSPIVGVVLMAVGVAGAVYGAQASSQGEVAIAASAVVSVLGMILLVPVVLVLLARLSRKLPLTLRYAVRDAARHRSRTVPAVAAVAATVAGVVALGIGVSSDESENRATYEPSLPSGVATVSSYDGPADGWTAYRAVVDREIPGATVATVRGVAEDETTDYTYLSFRVGGQDSADAPLLSSYGSALGASVLVSDDTLPPGMTGVAPADVGPAERMLAAGGVVVLVSSPLGADRVRVSAESYDPETGESDPPRRASLPALFVERAVDVPAGPQAVISSAAARKLDVPVSTVGLVVTGTTIGKQQESDAVEALGAISENATMYVERGYQAPDETVIIQLVLFALGGVLMLGGTLTATFLALSDARPDLATLAAVGASPRKRRGVAAAYAVVVGFVGALLGAAVGFIPGLAVTYPLTSSSGDTCVVNGSGACTSTGIGTGPFIDVPWLLILGLVIALPLLTALIVGLSARSRLPLVARLD